MARVVIIGTVHYGRLYRAGDITDLSQADAENLIAGGYAKPVEAPTPEEGGTPAGGSGQEDDSDANTGGEGPNAPPQPPAGEGEKDPLVCPHGCRDAKPFGSAAGLASHRKQVHDE